jgi:hypothetical protein
LTLSSAVLRLFEFHSLRGPQFPLYISSFMSTVDGNAAMVSGDPATYSRLLPSIVLSLRPASPYLSRFLSGVPEPDWCVIVDESKVAFFLGSAISETQAPRRCFVSWTIAWLPSPLASRPISVLKRQ